MCDTTEFIINNADRIQGTSHDYVIQTRTENMRLPSGAEPTRCKIKGIGFTNGLYNVNNCQTPRWRAPEGVLWEGGKGCGRRSVL